MPISHKNRQILLSVIIPAYNEEENFKRGVLDEVREFLAKSRFRWEVILVDDGSSDSTGKMLSSYSRSHHGFKFIRIRHGGKVSAISKGVKEAKGEIVIFSDFDQSTPISETEKFIQKFKKGADVVIANRFAKGATRIGDSFASYLRSKLFNLSVRLILMPDIHDSQCGFKGFRRNIARELFDKLLVCKTGDAKKPYMGAFDAELIFIAKKSGFKIVSTPVVWTRFTSSHLKFFEPIRANIDLIKIRIFDILGYYK